MDKLKNEIVIVDSIMGSGKTSWSIEYINENSNENILYITPFLTEVQRIKDSCNRVFKEPINKGKGKLFSLNEFLSCKEDIAATHELFKHLDKESTEHIKNGKYTLILDEVLNVIDPYMLRKDDLKILKDSNCITLDKDGFVIWNPNKKDYDSRFNEVKELAENKSLLVVNDKMLLWHYPPEIFGVFDKIYVLTYLFEASILSCYFDLYDIKYSKKSISNSNGKYELCNYYIAIPNLSDLVNVYNGNLNNNIHQKDNGLSSTWFEASINKNSIIQIKNNIYNYFKNIVKANGKSDSILWTTFKKQQPKLKGKGYTKQFLACNCRSTNEYADTYNLVYAINLYMHPSIMQFFTQRNIYPDQELYALAEMLQWIWRSRIRKGETINIYIPSNRMRLLFTSWLNGNIGLKKVS